MNFFNPSFLQKIDKHLLLNYPITWISKIHYIFFYCIISSLSLIGIGYLLPVNFNNQISSGTPILFVVIPILTGFIFYCIKYFRYNINSAHVNVSIFTEMYQYLLFWFCTSLILVQVLLTPFILEVRKANIFNEDEKQFINACQYYSLENQEHYDNTIIKINNETHRFNFERTPSTLLTAESEIKKVYYYRDRDTIFTHSKEQIIQNLEKYISFWNSNYSHKGKILETGEELYYNFIGKNKFIDHPKLKNTNEYYSYSTNWSIQTLISKTNNAITTIYDSQTYIAFLIIFSIVTLSIATLAWIFRHVKWRQFLAFFISAILLPIVIGILAGILLGIFDMDEDGFPAIVFCIYLIIVGKAIVGIKSNVFSSVSNVCLIFTQLLTPFVPLFLFIYAWELDSGIRAAIGYESKTQIMWYIYFTSEFLWIAMIPILKNSYTHMYNLPRKK